MSEKAAVPLSLNHLLCKDVAVAAEDQSGRLIEVRDRGFQAEGAGGRKGVTRDGDGVSGLRARSERWPAADYRVPGAQAIPVATAPVTLGNLAQTYTGSPLAATATTVPSGLTVILTYDGSTIAPTAPESYAVVATISDANYQGSTTGTLVISKATATVTLNGLMDGSRLIDGCSPVTPRKQSIPTLCRSQHQLWYFLSMKISEASSSGRLSLSRQYCRIWFSLLFSRVRLMTGASSS